MRENDPWQRDEGQTVPLLAPIQEDMEEDELVEMGDEHKRGLNAEENDAEKKTKFYPSSPEQPPSPPRGEKSCRRGGMIQGKKLP